MVPSERLSRFDGLKRLDIFDASVDVCIEFGMVFSDEWRERFGIPFLGARDEVRFVRSEQDYNSFSHSVERGANAFYACGQSSVTSAHPKTS